MAMLLLSFSKSSFGGARRALRTSAWAALLITFVFAGQAWGQVNPMRTALIEGNNAIPVNSVTAFTGQTVSGVDLSGDRVVHTDVTGNTTLDPDGNNLLNPAVAAMPVVDWILVQGRVVDKVGGNPGPAPTAFDYCTNNPCPTKAVFLFADGSVSDTEEDNLGAGMVTFEELEFDETTQDLYVAVYHRNHLAILSATGAGSTDGEGVHTFDLDVATNLTLQDRTVSLDAARLPTGKVAMRGGKVDTNNTVNINDFDEITPRLDVGGQEYSVRDTNLNGFVNIDDRDLVVPNLDTPPEAFSFF